MSCRRNSSIGSNGGLGVYSSFIYVNSDVCKDVVIVSSQAVFVLFL